MNSVLSLVSGQFTRSLVFGAFFPVVVFLVAGVLAVDPLLPKHLPLLQTFQNLDSTREILLFTFTAIVVTLFLYNLNTPIVRMFEGYPWRRSWLGIRRREHYQQRYEELSRAVPRLRVLARARVAIDPSDPSFAKLQTRLDQFGSELFSGFPTASGYVLPTRFGNVVRSFEGYPRAEYGMDGITFWPRLIGVVPKDALTGVDDARSAVDFFLNGCFLSWLLSAVLFATGSLTTNSQTPILTLVMWPVETVAAAIAGLLFYEGAVNRASAWGAQVKSVFDLYRWDLLKKMGYTQTPSNREEERAVWRPIARQILYGDPVGRSPLPYKKPDPPSGTFVTASPADLPTELSAGVKPNLWGRRSFVWRVRNLDPQRPATSLRLTVTLPGEIEYVWDSAKIDGTPCQVTGLNSLVVDLGTLAAGGSVEFTCRGVRSKAK